jgi:hypothetical protein
MSISQAVQEAIRNNLPGQVADEMRAFIENAQQTEKLLARAQEQNRTLTDEIGSLEATLSQHQAVAVRERAVGEREKAAEAKEIELIKLGARMEADVAKAELKGVRETQTQFLANSVVRRTVLENSQELVVGQYNNGYSQVPPTQTVPTFKTTTTTEEQA